MILAIDPGPKQSAILEWDGCSVARAEILPNADVIGHLATCSPERKLYIERVACYGMAVGEDVFETVYWTGRFAQAWSVATQGKDCIRIPRRELKIHLCGSMKAKDANIRQALIDRFGAPGVKSARGVLYGVKSHCWAALALAVYAHDTL